MKDSSRDGMQGSARDTGRSLIEKDRKYNRAIPLQEYRELDSFIEEWTASLENLVQLKEKTDLLEVTGVEPDVLDSYFKNFKHTTFRTWKAEKKIEEAKKLLCSEEDYSLQQIAEILKYGDVSSFSKTFRNKVGYPPKKWKNCGGLEKLLEEEDNLQ